MLHQAKGERGYQEDTALAKSDPTIAAIMFDLQQTLPTPSLSTNVVSYQRQLCTYNLGIHELHSGLGCMHMWSEDIASRGSNEVGSCILKHLQDMNLAPSVTHLITYSDSCGGQNRNINIVCLWLHIVACNYLPITTVDQKFMLSGHTFLPNDRDFGSVELAKKRHPTVYVPDEWYELVRGARHKNPFVVSAMNTESFVSIKSLTSNIVNRKQNIDKAQVNWFKILWIRVTKDKPLQFLYRYSLNELEVWKVVNLARKTRGRPTNLGTIQLPQLRSGPCKPRSKIFILCCSIFHHYTTDFIRTFKPKMKVVIVALLTADNSVLLMWIFVQCLSSKKTCNSQAEVRSCAAIIVSTSRARLRKAKSL